MCFFKQEIVRRAVRVKESVIFPVTSLSLPNVTDYKKNSSSCEQKDKYAEYSTTPYICSYSALDHNALSNVQISLQCDKCHKTLKCTKIYNCLQIQWNWHWRWFIVAIITQSMPKRQAGQLKHLKPKLRSLYSGCFDAKTWLVWQSTLRWWLDN